MSGSGAAQPLGTEPLGALAAVRGIDDGEMQMLIDIRGWRSDDSMTRPEFDAAVLAHRATYVGAQRPGQWPGLFAMCAVPCPPTNSAFCSSGDGVETVFYRWLRDADDELSYAERGKGRPNNPSSFGLSSYVALVPAEKNLKAQISRLREKVALLTPSYAPDPAIVSGALGACHGRFMKTGKDPDHYDLWLFSDFDDLTLRRALFPTRHAVTP